MVVESSGCCPQRWNVSVGPYFEFGRKKPVVFLHSNRIAAADPLNLHNPQDYLAGTFGKTQLIQALIWLKITVIW